MRALLVLRLRRYACTFPLISSYPRESWTKVSLCEGKINVHHGLVPALSQRPMQSLPMFHSLLPTV